MSMVVRTNINSMNANRNLSINNNQVAKSIQKLASGYAINSAADDSSGLAITEKMRAQITGLDQGTDNALDGVCLVQTAEGGMNEIHNMLNRMTELATKSANGTIQDEVDREAIQAEVDVLVDEIDRIAKSTNYNGIPLLDGSLAECGAGVGSGGTIGGASVELNINTSLSTTVGSFTITGGVEGTDFSYSGGVLTILSSTHMRIEDGNNSESIVVSDSAGSANLALKDVNITSSTGSAFYTGNNDVYIELEGDNELRSNYGSPSAPQYGSAGLNVGEYGSIVIDGTGSLTAQGSANGSGIGTGSSEVGGNITINGGYIFAEGGMNAAGIGTGLLGTLGDITITNGNIISSCDSGGGAGIGGGAGGTTIGNIIISGGTIEALSLHMGAGIGSGWAGIGGDIIITGGNITAISDWCGAGIGTGAHGTIGDIIYVEECVTAVGGDSLFDDYHGYLGVGQNIGAGYMGTVGRITKECGLTLHVGDQNATFNKIQVYIDPMTGEALKIKPLYVDTQDAAALAIDKIKAAINYVSENRGNLGAMQNRLEHTVNTNKNTSENMESAKSVIKDTDMASEMMEYTKMNVLTQSAQSMLAQTNQAPQSILELLG